MVTSYVDAAGGGLFGGVADVTFTNGDPDQVDPNIDILWDFDNDGDFDEPEETITSVVMVAESSTGRDWPSNLQGKGAPGILQVTVNNTDDRFSYFNAASPLATDPFSLRTGRKIRVQTSGTANPDPVLLARDRFREDGVLAVDETGEAWTNVTAGIVKHDGRATVDVPGPPLATVDVTSNDYYAQITSEFLDAGSGNAVSIIYRRQDANNQGIVMLNALGVQVINVVAGVGTTVASYPVEFDTHQHLTFGIHAHGTTADLYIEGVLVGSGTAATFTGGVVGIEIFWNTTLSRAPAVEEFWVFDGLPTVEVGVIWTGDVASVVPSAVVDGVKTATITAEGRLARVANVDVTMSGAATAGRKTGVAIGHILNRAGVHTPPGPLDEGNVTTGPFGFPTSNALELARQFEETELGFLYEQPEGYLTFDGRTGRSLVASQAGFSDAPGAQFNYAELTPFDWRKEIVNRVSAGVSALPPGTPTTTTRTGNTAAGVANHVTVQMPATLDPTDLLVVFIASTVHTAGVRYSTPDGWTALIDPGDQYALGVYARPVTTAALAGANVTFYTDTGASGGAWVAIVYRVPNWFRSMQGIEVVPAKTSNGFLGESPAAGADPPPIAPSWGFNPTLFIAASAGLVSVGGISVPVPHSPNRYLDLTDTALSGTVNGFDVGLGTAHHYDNVELEDPGTFGPFSDVVFAQSTVVAIRGPNSGAPFTNNFDNPGLVSGFVTVERNDPTSQDEHNSVRTHRNAAGLFSSIAEATDYADEVLGLYSDDRPIFSLSFWATTNSHYRAQALNGRVGSKITLTADGATGMGVTGAEFFIEKVIHSWPDAKRWKVTYELSPA